MCIILRLGARNFARHLFPELRIFPSLAQGRCDLLARLLIKRPVVRCEDAPAVLRVAPPLLNLLGNNPPRFLGVVRDAAHTRPIRRDEGLGTLCARGSE